MGEQKEYQKVYYKSHKEEIRLRKIAERRALTKDELRVLSYYQVERFLDKHVDPEASRIVAIGLMRSGFGFGDEIHKDGAAEIVARRLDIWRGGYPDSKKVRLWYEEILEQDKKYFRVLAQNRGL